MPTILSAKIESQKKFNCKGPNSTIITINRNIQQSQSGMEVKGEWVVETEGSRVTVDTSLKFCNLYRVSICEMCGELCPVTNANEFELFLLLRKKA